MKFLGIFQIFIYFLLRFLELKALIWVTFNVLELVTMTLVLDLIGNFHFPAKNFF